eukprot:CAMPEP_0195002084 /NCGR_PEP_ID=MMETSP0326_2-20130528/2175_1 /TAXON_ID=2866 ORGANISM="Crypthecodinium cohnii, Strain Seligo" /NCGR_SAMPLE_ID=MMETSP0326_2 /ASSEMBLY_ACC=CAM_ASM_000348 /LENGTH=68 /DNA_ID=CAMNT_0040005313 /DNA_START=620 /DNA_END=823 /DNA_ORIENTATION=+
MASVAWSGCRPMMMLHSERTSGCLSGKSTESKVSKSQQGAVVAAKGSVAANSLSSKDTSPPACVQSLH